MFLQTMDACHPELDSGSVEDYILVQISFMVMGFYKLSLTPTVRARGARSVGMERVGPRGTLNGGIKCRRI